MFSLRFWIVALLTGVGAGVGAVALMALLRVVQHAAWSYSAGDFLSAVDRVTPLHRVEVVVGAGLVAGIGVVLIRAFTRDGPGLSSALWFHSGRLPFGRTIANAVLSIVIVGLGASLGREAAPKEVGAAIAGSFSDRFGLTSAQRRLLVACGAGAGMAAVYNVPLGGAVFALEVMLGTLALPLVLPALVTSLIATAVAWIALPMVPTFSLPTYGATASLVVWAIIFGPLAGLASAGFVRVIVWTSARKPVGRRATVAACCSIFTLLAGLSIVLPQILGNGRNIVALAFVDHIGVALLALVLLAKLAATAGCVYTGAPGGLLMPSMSIGALLGGLLGHFWQALWPTEQLGAYAVIGAGAVLAATTQGPISAIVLVLELTDRCNALAVPLMLAVAGAMLVARRVEPRSVYSGRISVDVRVPPLDPDRAPALAGIITRDYRSISASAAYAAVLRACLAPVAAPLYVLDERGRFLGTILPEQLVADNVLAALPPATATAADLALRSPVIDSEMTEQQIKHRFATLDVTRLPAVEHGSGRFLGVVERNAVRASNEEPRMEDIGRSSRG